MDATASAGRMRNGERDTRLALKRTCLVLLTSCVAISSWLWPQAQLQVGYTLLTAESGSTAPVAAALFSFSTPNGILVSQAGVAATEPIPAGRIFVDEADTQTGLALVNPSTMVASVSLILRDTSGNEITRTTLSLPAGRHLPRFVSELFPDLPGGFTGSLTFESNQRLAAITLRQRHNAQGEPLYATLPVVDLSLPATAGPIVFPQIAAGGGCFTELVLINSTAQALRGQVALSGSDGNPLSLLLNGNSTSSVPYQISPHGTYRATLDRSGDVVAGYAVVTPEPGTTTPSGTAIFSGQTRRNHRDGGRRCRLSFHNCRSHPGRQRGFLYRRRPGQSRKSTCCRLLCPSGYQWPFRGHDYTQPPAARSPGHLRSRALSRGSSNSERFHGAA